MNESLFDTVLIKLEDSRDNEPIMVGLASYLEFSGWIDDQLESLRDEFHEFETVKSHRLAPTKAPSS